MTLPVLLASGAALLGGSFVAWRRAGRLGAVAAVLWTAWLAEAGLEALASAPAAQVPVGRRPAAAGTVVAGSLVTDDFLRPPSDVPRLLVIGDSFTTVAATPDTTLPAQLGAELARRGTPVDVLAHGDAGASFVDELAGYAALGAPAAPAATVWVVVLNDLGGNGLEGPDFIVDRPPRPTGLRLLDVVRDGLHARSIEERTVAAYHRALAPDRPERGPLLDGLGALAAAERTRGARLLVVLYPLMHALDRYPFAEDHARLVADLRARGVEVLDLLEVFRGRDAEALWMDREDHHPNAAGHALAAAAVADALGRDGLPAAGPVDCDTIPVVPAVAEVARAACRAPTPPSLLAYARALLEVAPSPPWVPFGHATVAERVAAVAGARSAEGDPARAEAEALVARARGRR